MGNSTVYDVRLQYSLADGVTKPAKRMDAQLVKTSKGAGMLGKSFRRLAAGAGAYFGIRAGVKHLIGFNDQMQQSRIQMAGMIQLTTGLDSAASSSRANDLVDTLQQKAKLSVGTTKDMVDMASMITRPVLAAGVGMSKLADFTAQAVVASRAFGIESGMAARDIEAALMGQLRSVDRFSRALLEPLGYVGEEGRKAFNELGAAARAAKLEEALGGDAIKSMAAAQENSFSGVLSTFQDTLQMTMGEVGLPLFKEVTDEIRTWNEWITKNGDKVSDLGTSMGKGLVTGFKAIKSVIGFLVDHSGVLLTVAQAWAAIKVSQMMGGMGGKMAGIGGSISRFGGRALEKNFDRVGLASAKMGASITTVGQSLAGLALGIGLAVTAVYAFERYMNKDREADLKQKENEKGEALRLVDAYNVTKRGIVGLAGRADQGTTSREQIEDLAFLQSGRAEGVPLSTEEIGLAQSLVDSQKERQQFYKDISSLAFQTQAVTRTGHMTRSTFDDDASAMRRVLGGVIGADGVASNYSEGELYSALNALSTELGASGDATKTLSEMMRGVYVAGPVAQAETELAALRNQSGSVGKKPEFKVTIQRIEVQSDDPSRFVVGLTETVRDAVRNRSAAYETFVEGN